ncbi:MAG: sugar ABC transporter substrate-binding protein, partial [Gaiellaceae bacterium]
MKKRTWRFALLAALLALVLGVAACGGDDSGGSSEPAAPAEEPAAPAEEPAAPAEEPAASGEPVRIAFFMAAVANTYSVATLEAINDVAAADGNVTVTEFDGMFDAAAQLIQVQDAVTSGNFDAFIIGANDGNQLVPAVEEAIADGIHVSCTLIPCGPELFGDVALDVQIDGQVSYVGTSFPNNGAAIGNAVIAACEGIDPCKVAYLPGFIASPFDEARTQGFEEAVGTASNIEIVSIQEGFYTADGALGPMQNILQANPDLNAVGSAGDQMIVGAEQAVIDAGLEGRVALIGNGASDIGKEAITSGRWFASAVYLPYTEGKVAAE